MFRLKNVILGILVVCGMVLTLPVLATFADGGGGGSSSGAGNGSGAYRSGVYWFYRESFGAPTLDSMKRALTENGVKFVYTGDPDGKLLEAVNKANGECHARSGGKACRLVAVGISATNRHNGRLIPPQFSGHYGGETDTSRGVWKKTWLDTTQGQTYYYNGASYNIYSVFTNYPDTSINTLVNREIDSVANGHLAVVAIVLAEDEPVPPNYTLSITTDKGNPFTTHLGNSTPVYDVLHVDNGGSSIIETLSAEVYLNWEHDGLVKSPVKSFNISNKGDVNSPSFTPADFGWSEWKPGRYWFDVLVNKQGVMLNAVNTPDRDPRETWDVPFTPGTLTKVIKQTRGNDANDKNIASGQRYDAEISARSLGYRKMVFKDIIKSDKVKIGSPTADDKTAVKIINPDGRAVQAEVTITRLANQVVVEGVVTDNQELAEGTWKMLVPTYVEKSTTDFDVPDTASVCWGVANPVCKDSPDTPEVHKVTPKPNKAWVIGVDGALETTDPEHTNRKGVDQKVFTAGDTVWAVVNGKIPANLVSDLSHYSITDDWTSAAPYMDFAPHVRDTRVFANGQDVTDQFDIRIEGTKTVATAKASYLATLAGHSTQDTHIKLAIKGTIKQGLKYPKTMLKILNGGSERLGNDEVPTNIPPIFVRTPNPNKVWVLDKDDALVQSDPDKTNDKGSDNRTFVAQDWVSAMVEGRLPATFGAPLRAYEIVDDWTGAAKHVDFNYLDRVRVYVDGVDHTADFNIRIQGTKTIATAKPELLNTTQDMLADKVVKLVIDGKFKEMHLHGNSEKLTNAGSEKWNNAPEDTNVPAVFVRTPDPNKVWSLDGEGALKLGDPDKTNNVNADQKIFLKGDTVGAAIHGYLPKNLAKDLTAYQLVDDWTDASKYVDFTDAKRARVYMEGTDVTDMFNIHVEGITTVADAKPEFLKGTEKQLKDRKVVLIIEGEFRQDYHTHGEVVKLTNGGWEKWNDQPENTNIPPVFTWTPDPKKDVIASAAQGGDQSSIDGYYVFPGQTIEYKVDLDLRIPEPLGREVENFEVEDIYDPNFIPNRSSVEFYDARDASLISKKFYKTKWDDVNHKFRVTFDKGWVAKHATSKTTEGWLILRFDGKVREDIASGTNIDNQAYEIINKSVTPTPKPRVIIPPFEPVKEDLDTDGVDIDGKTVVTQDKIVYRVTLDATANKMAYKVHKLGIVDDFDEEYLDIVPEGIQVLDQATSEDVTDKFNIQIKNGVAYIFAKHVDHENNEGDLIKGTQPEDLETYADEGIDPIKSPIIDQALLGKNYWVILNATVKKSQDGCVIKNQARQTFENMIKRTNIVSNPLKEINPKKDVVVTAEGVENSINKGTVEMSNLFSYKLTSSTIPANRAYKTKDWGIRDDFDPVHDRFTGVYKIVADEQIGSFKKGDVLAECKPVDLVQVETPAREGTPKKKVETSEAGTQTDSVKMSEIENHRPVTCDNSVLFNVSWTSKGEAEFGSVHVEGTQQFFDILNRQMDKPAGWSVYIQMERLIPGTVKNVFTEHYNEVDRPSNEVVTETPENPLIDIEYWDDPSGQNGNDNRDTPDKGSETGDKPTPVSFTITNTGNVPLKNVKFNHEVVHGGGVVTGITCEASLEGKILQVGEKVICHGTLEPLTPGTEFTGSSSVTGESVYTGNKVSDSDPWNAYRPAPPTLAETGTKALMFVLAILGLLGTGLGAVVTARGGSHKRS